VSSLLRVRDQPEIFGYVPNVEYVQIRVISYRTTRSLGISCVSCHMAHGSGMVTPFW